MHSNTLKTWAASLLSAGNSWWTWWVQLTIQSHLHFDLHHMICGSPTKMVRLYLSGGGDGLRDFWIRAVLVLEPSQKVSGILPGESWAQNHHFSCLVQEIPGIPSEKELSKVLMESTVKTFVSGFGSAFSSLCPSRYPFRSLTSSGVCSKALSDVLRWEISEGKRWRRC